MGFSLRKTLKTSRSSNIIYILLLSFLSVAALIPAIYATFYANGNCVENAMGHFYVLHFNHTDFSIFNMLTPPPS